MGLFRGHASEVTCASAEQDELRVGDAVEICLSDGRVLLAAAVTYGVLLACITGSVAAVAMVAGMDSDALSAVACASGFAIGAVLIRLLGRRHDRLFVPTARRPAKHHSVSQ
jgi:positive regulator of sigma E activity